jgi:hypothetical protein
MSSKRFGKKAKKPKDKEKNKKSEAAIAADKNSVAPTKGAQFQQKHFQRRTSG